MLLTRIAGLTDAAMPAVYAFFVAVTKFHRNVQWVALWDQIIPQKAIIIHENKPHQKESSHKTNVDSIRSSGVAII